MVYKCIYYLIKIFSKKQALNYAIKRQIISANNKCHRWYYWYERIMEQYGESNV